MCSYINALCSNRALSFANARTMKHLARTIYEQVILREIEDKNSPRKVVLLEDVANYTWKQQKTLGYSIGFADSCGCQGASLRGVTRGYWGRSRWSLYWEAREELRIKNSFPLLN